MTSGDDAVRFRVLGPVESWRDGNRSPIVGEKQRTLLALLVLRANQVVPHDALLHALWGENRPGTGRRALHNHLWSLRRLLGADTCLSTSAGGYSLRVSPGGSDLSAFLAEVTAGEAARAADDLPLTAERFRVALDLWRGPALGGTRAEFQAEAGGALEESRLSALTSRIEADLALGRHAELVGELRQLIAVAPLRERFRAQLMLALYRDGRRGEALEQYRLARRCLMDELGLEPGEELMRLHQAILSDAPGLRGFLGPAPLPGDESIVDVAPSSRLSSRPVLVPRQLPSDIIRFVGREWHLRELDELLAPNGTPVLLIAAIAGTGGVGKTALAVRWGHRRAAQFPDGHLYVNLHGFSHSDPVTPARALWQLLRGLGVPAEEIPLDLDERSALYRSALSGKCLLILLDNAATADQVRPLLPGTSPSRVLITSRDSLRGLTATHDVEILPLDLLSPEEAERLIRALLGGDRTGEPIGELAALCGHLPLALRLAAARLRDAGEPVSELVSRLRAGDRLDALSFAEDPHIGIRSTFALSYAALPEPVRETFRVVGLHPGLDVSLDALAAMTGQDAETTRGCVATLDRAYLVSHAERRVRIHDLIREYARQIAREEGGRREVQERLLGWHVHTARAAMAHVDPDSGLLTPAVPELAGGVRTFAGRDDAIAWLNEERHNTVALVAHAAENGLPVHAWQLAYITAYYFYLCRHIDDWIATCRVGLKAARQLEDLTGEAMMLTVLGYAFMEADQYRRFLDCQRRALELAIAIGDRRLRAEAQHYVAFGLFRTGALTAALDANAMACELYRELDDHAGMVATDYLAGQIYVRLGKSGRALKCFERHLVWLGPRGRRHDEAHTLFETCMARLGLGQLPQAEEAAELALDIARELNDRLLEALALHHLGQVMTRRGSFAAALRLQEEALALACQLPGRLTECMVLNGLGRTHASDEDREAATARFSDALELAMRIDDPYELDAARSGLATLG